jgi:hypothetical protein
MKTFQDYLSSAAHEGTVNVLFEAGMYSLLDDLERIVSLLRQAGVAFEVVGGMAVNAHLLAARERSRTFVTRDIDLLVRRSDLPNIVAAAETAGYLAKKIVGGYMLIRADQQPAEAVHLVFSGERSKSIHPLPHPPIRPEEKQLFEMTIPVAPLADLVQMKLNSFRPKDLVHLETLDNAGLINAEIEANLLPALGQRLREARAQFELNEPDVEE